MNAWIVRTTRGKKVIDINPTKHSVIMGRLHDKATGRMIGTVLRLAPEQPAAQPATATEGSPHNVATNVARIFGTGGSV